MGTTTLARWSITTHSSSPGRNEWLGSVGHDHFGERALSRGGLMKGAGLMATSPAGLACARAGNVNVCRTEPDSPNPTSSAPRLLPSRERAGVGFRLQPGSAA